jgi:VWFA-related protein
MIAALCFVAALGAQTPAQQPSPAVTFRSGVDAVEVDVSVMRGSTVVTGLTAGNFTLTDNGVPQEVASVTLDKLPLTVMLLLDTSASVAGEKLTRLVDATRGLAMTLRPDDRAALITFSQQVRVRAPIMRDKSALVASLSGLIGHGATALNDALEFALQLRPIDNTRTVLLLFTDGVDTASWLTSDKAIDAARRAGVVIQAVELHTNAAKSPFLDRLAESSGGRVWSASSPADLQKLFTQALDEMRARYLLTFTPRGVTPDGWHDLKVTLKNARGDVTARPAYFVSPPPK